MQATRTLAAALIGFGLTSSPATSAIIGVSGAGDILDPTVTPVGMTANFFQDTALTS